MNNEQLQEIAKQINEMIESSIRERAPERDLESQFEEFTWRFKDALQDAVFLKDDYKDQGLNFSALEAEGFLRAMLQIENLLESVTNYKKD